MLARGREYVSAVPVTACAESGVADELPEHAQRYGVSVGRNEYDRARRSIHEFLQVTTPRKGFACQTTAAPHGHRRPRSASPTSGPVQPRARHCCESRAWRDHEHGTRRRGSPDSEHNGSRQLCCPKVPGWRQGSPRRRDDSRNRPDTPPHRTRCREQARPHYSGKNFPETEEHALAGAGQDRQTHRSLLSRSRHGPPIRPPPASKHRQEELFSVGRLRKCLTRLVAGGNGITRRET